MPPELAMSADAFALPSKAVLFSAGAGASLLCLLVAARSLLSRTILLETLKLTCFFGGAYIALICIALGAPLVRGGAPILDVILFMPNQLVFPAILALPLALVTATLSCLARMQGDGETVALMATGVSNLRIVRSSLPLALLMACAVGYLTHVALPIASRNFARGKASLLRQATATKVARQEPIFQQSDTYNLNQSSLAAAEAEGNRLSRVFGWHRDENGRLFLGYAPEAVWQTEDFFTELTPEQRAQLQEQIDKLRQIMDDLDAWDVSPQTRGAMRKALQTRIDELLRRLQAPKHVSRMSLHLVNLRFLHHTREPPPMPRDLDVLDTREPVEHEIPYPIIAGRFPQWTIRLVEDIGEHSSPETKSTEELAANITTMKRVLAMIRKTIDQYREDLREPILRVARKRLIAHQYVWHLRWMMPLAVLAYWLLASGMGLWVPARNRLVAVFIGLITVIGTILPAIAVIKGSADHLPVNPGLILWTPPALMATVGLLLLAGRR